MQFSIQMVRGFRNVLFGGEGLFLATLTGPGATSGCRACPIMNLFAEEIGRYLPGGSDGGGTPRQSGRRRHGGVGSSGVCWVTEALPPASEDIQAEDHAGVRILTLKPSGETQRADRRHVRGVGDRDG